MGKPDGMPRNLVLCTIVLPVVFLALSGCRHKPVSVQCPALVAPDSLVLRSVKANSNPTFLRGQPAALLASIQYTLVSQDKAILEINLDQFPSTLTCSRDLQGMIRLLPMSRIPITRGTHVIEVPLTWPGDTGEGAAGQVFGKGTFSIEGSIIAEQLNYSLLTSRFGLIYCTQF